jgi:tRNA pseudouridine55 synthase
VKDGALLVDKPVGLSSNAALQIAKRLFQAGKAGHAGTLDPLASGLLIVLLGEATKFAGLLLEQDKEYLATLKLGERTATGDAEGEILERKTVAVDEPMLKEVLARFRGEIEQVPPMHSALKRDGVPLYKLARKGVHVERERRRVRIREIELLKQEKDLLEIRVACSKGTYVRVLAEDIGAALGTCAHLGGLRRTASGGFRIEDAIGLEALQALAPEARHARLLPLGALLADLPRVDLAPDAAARLRNGQTLKISGLQEGLIAAYAQDGVLIGLARAADGGLRPLRLTQAADLHR